MKSELGERNCRCYRPFPKLMARKIHPHTIILATRQDNLFYHGVIIHGESKKGEGIGTSGNFIPDEFTDYIGTVTLCND